MSTSETKATSLASVSDGPPTLQDVLQVLRLAGHQPVTLPEPRDCPTRWLSPVERATVRVKAPSLAEVVLMPSIVGQAAARLAAFQDRGVLEYFSGQYVATLLHQVFYSWHPVAYRKAKRGWTLLAEIDSSSTGIVVWTSAEPLPDDPAQRFRRMRLHERLDELAARSERQRTETK
jgi:hypothetical protein